jgi:glycosyltransferase involved in cell wall biosynthesis
MCFADVAVVVPVYNRASTVIETLATVAHQSLKPQRLIVVDDGSTDGTAAAVKQWIAAERPLFETLVVSQSNQGAGAARNRGLAAAGPCRYVLFLDSDDRLPEDYLSRAFTRMEADQTAVAATSDRLYHRQWKRRLGFRTSRRIERNATVWLLTNNSGITSCTLFRTDVIRRLGGFDASLPTGQDLEMFLRVSREGRWLHVPGNPVGYYVGFSTAQGEAGNLSFKYANRLRRWVRIRERFIFKQGGGNILRTRFYQGVLAKSWHKIARFYLDQGNNVLALASFRRALRYQPARIATWLRLGQMAFGRYVMPSAVGRQNTASPTNHSNMTTLPVARDSAA